MTSEELAKTLKEVATDLYVKIAVLQEHYIETISQLTHKDKFKVIEELDKLIPEQKKKAEMFIKAIIELTKVKSDVN